MCSIVYSKLFTPAKTTLIFYNLWMEKQIVIYPSNGLLHSIKNLLTSDT